MNLVPETFQSFSTDRLSSGAAPETLLAEYAETLRGKAAGTTDAYLRVLRQLLAWLAERPGGDPFDPRQLTRTAVEIYLAELGVAGYSLSHRARVKAVVGGFARCLLLRPQRSSASCASSSGPIVRGHHARRRNPPTRRHSG